MVVWSLRTTPSRSTGFTPFFLVYGAEAILPMDLEYGSPRVRQLDEARTMALMHFAIYQQALRCYQARKVRSRDLDEGDLVLWLRQDNRGRHKLSPPWEGTYVVVKVLKPDPYNPANEDGEKLTNAWNIQQLRRFYPYKGFPSSFCNYIPNTPVGCTNENSFEIIKSKGNLAFPRKPSHPRGLLRVRHPQKVVSFFAKSIANVPSTPRPRIQVNLYGTRVAKGRRSASQG
jgi:hypothetical protein